ncbi:MAG TPA: hypothetical protein VF469_11220 [Kofleriaceae bacterium]
MGGSEVTRRPEADLALRTASESSDRSKSPVPMLSGVIAEIAEIADDTDSRGTLSQYACSCHGCRTCHGCREAGPS